MYGATAGGRAVATHGSPTGPRRAWTAVTLFATSLVAVPAVAQDNYYSYPDWDDIGWFRSCAVSTKVAWAQFAR
ncbi:MAG: hypothetical protein F4X47_10470 [Gammaproteobacteria bacterium]|nr:hypothetical protein [Gammaproteobacteria bacterium]